MLTGLLGYTVAKLGATYPSSGGFIAYLQQAKTPDDIGGWGIGHIGPVPEGMVAWLIAGVALIAMCAVLGARLRA